MLYLVIALSCFFSISALNAVDMQASYMEEENPLDLEISETLLPSLEEISETNPLEKQSDQTITHTEIFADENARQAVLSSTKLDESTLQIDETIVDATLTEAAIKPQADAIQEPTDLSNADLSDNASEKEKITEPQLDNEDTSDSPQHLPLRRSHHRRPIYTTMPINVEKPQEKSKYPTLAWATLVSYASNSNNSEENRDNLLAEYDFVADSISTGESKVAYRASDKTLFIFFRGSQTKADWTSTDPILATGNLKKTPRYTRSYAAVKAAKAKYPKARHTIIFGHSLGGALASAVGKEKMCKKDRIFTYNKGVGVNNFNPLEKSNPKETAYRTKGDLVSALGLMNKNAKTLRNSSSFTDLLGTHNDLKKTGSIILKW